jgi:hypothetical protein
MNRIGRRESPIENRGSRKTIAASEVHHSFVTHLAG